jgi:FkbM family methyltransferase
VGANEGQYAAGMRALGFTGQIISFEPLDGAFPKLRNRCANDGDWQCHQLAIGDSDAEVIIKVAGNLESSSILPMMDVHVEAYPESKYVAEQKVNVTRLDSILPGNLKGGKKDRLMLKLDVQGYELKALQGAEGIFDQVEIVDIEVSLLPLYEGQPSLVELINFFESRGFIPVSFENAFTDPRNGHALQVDAVFMRGGESKATA